MINLSLKRNQNGDTIIEVLLAITILGAVIASAYVISSRAMSTTRQNNERNQAIRYAETQLEYLKDASVNNSNFDTALKNQLSSGADKCFSPSGGGYNITSGNNCKLDNKYETYVKYYDPTTNSGDEYFVATLKWEGDRGPQRIDVPFRAYYVDYAALANPPAPPAPPAPVIDSNCAPGGTVENGYEVHVFNGNGTFRALCDMEVEYLVVGGGGAGGAGNQNEGGGGGGGGGFVEGRFNVTSGTSYPIVVGSGGIASNDVFAAPRPGSNSSAFGAVGLGGGGGAACWVIPGGSGGSGGGGSGCGDAFHAAGNATQPAPGFGNAGGIGQWTSGGPNGCNGNGGGGGGAGGAGLSGAARDAGSCGNWVKCADENFICSFSGTKQVRYGKNSTWLYQSYPNGVKCDNDTFGDPLVGTYKECQIGGSGSIGGAGAARNSTLNGSAYAAGGNGGAGRSSHIGANGAANTGNGGGGSANFQQPGNGGSGIVIIRFRVN